MKIEDAIKTIEDSTSSPDDCRAAAAVLLKNHRVVAINFEAAGKLLLDEMQKAADWEAVAKSFGTLLKNRSKPGMDAVITESLKAIEQ